jgi:hypothetical protein
MSSERGNARRQFLKASGLAAVALSTAPLRAGRAEDLPAIADATMPGPTVRKRPPLAPVKASMDRLLSLEACLRPFRPQGPRRLIPQPEVDYAISYDSQNVYTIPRRDGVIVQEWSPGDYGNDQEVPNRAATQASMEKIARLCEHMGVRAQ